MTIIDHCIYLSGQREKRNKWKINTMDQVIKKNKKIQQLLMLTSAIFMTTTHFWLPTVDKVIGFLALNIKHYNID